MAVTPIHPSRERLKLQQGKTMVKILEIGCPVDVEEDDDCCEIDLAEFAKKVNLKAADDDVVVVTAKGPIKAKDIRKKKIRVKVEVDESGDCSENNGNLHDRVAGDCFDNPFEVEEDETASHQIMESADATPDVKFDITSPVKCQSEGFQEVIPDMLPVKSEPEDGNSADELFEQAISDVSPVKCESEGFEEVVSDTSAVKREHDEDCSGVDEHFEQVIPDMSLLKFGSVCFEEVMPPVKPAPEDGDGADEHFEEVIADMSPVKCGPDEGNSMDELFEQVIPDVSPVRCESESFEEVVADMSPVKSQHEGADEHFEEVVIPDMTLLKCDFECFEEFIPDMSPVKHEPEDGNDVSESVQEDAYDHLPEADRLNEELFPGGSVFDEEDGDDFVVVGREAL